MIIRSKNNGYHYSLTNRNIQIIGGITNVPDYKERFEKAENYLISKGNIVWNPVKEVSSKLPYKQQMNKCLSNLLKVDSIFCLNNWAFSDGARAEYFTAYSYKLDIFFEKFYSVFLKEALKQYIADEFNNLGMASIIGTRKREVVAFKSILAYLLYFNFGVVIQDIADVLANDHSSVLKLINNAKQSLKSFKTNNIRDEIVIIMDYHLQNLNKLLGGYYGAEVRELQNEF